MRATKNSKMRKIASFFTLMIALFIGAMTIFAAYSGHIDPRKMTLAPLMCMTLPYWVIATLIMLPICFIANKWQSLVPLSTLVICLGPILNFCPLNITSNSNRNTPNSFTLLSYNAYNFIAFDDNYPDDESNSTLNYIAKTDADIVCLQECEYLSPIPRWHVYRKQVNAIKEQYPYRIIGANNGQSIFSKFPVTLISSAGYYSHFEVEMPTRTIDIIDVHLRSIRLSKQDKEQYNEALTDLITENNNSKLSSWKNIASKVANAAKLRSRQALALKDYIKGLDSENIIVCGDFNDVPGCFAINAIADDFDDVYAQCGFGPMITYHGNNLKFRIDHILYDGDFDATYFERGDLKSSDHYPLFATFKWDND